MMKLCVTSRTISTGTALAPDHETLARTVAEAGFEQFDFGFNTPMLAQENALSQVMSIAEAYEKGGVHPQYVHLPYDYPSGGDASAWQRYTAATMLGIDAAAELGVVCAAIHPRSYMTENYDPDAEYAKAVEFLAPFCEYAKKKNVALAIEVMRGAGRSAPATIRRFGGDTDDLIRLADEMNEGICWDTGHANISMQPQYESLKKIGHRLRMIHVNDNFAENDVHILPFLGNVDWNGVIAGLKEVGYTGSMNLEVYARPFPPAVQMDYLRCMAQSARELIRRLAEA